MAVDKLSGTASTNAYGDTNTQSYEDTIKRQYSDMLSQRDSAADAALSTAESRLSTAQTAGEKQYEALLSQAQRDRTEAKTTKSAIEQANGNRQKIGASQYDSADQSYDQQRAAIYQARAKLQKDTARQLSDLQAQGEYEKADALLTSKQQELQQIYEDALRADTNLRSNYEYQVGLQREDEEIQREQDETDKSWLRSIGEMFLQKGVMPTDSSLEAMGIDQDTAQLYINALGYGSGSSSGGSSGSSGSSSGSSKSSGSGDDTGGDGIIGDDSGGLSFGSISSYDNRIAQQVYMLAEAGNLTGAMNWLGSKTDYFSAANFGVVEDTARKKAAAANSKASNSKTTTGNSNNKTTTSTVKSSTNGKTGTGRNTGDAI
jgi:hypothetical protein